MFKAIFLFMLMHLSTGPDYTQNVIKVYCPVDADAG